MLANGTAVGPELSSDGQGAWQQHTVTINTGSSNSLRLVLRDQERNATGNDFGLDDVSLTYKSAPIGCGPAYDSGPASSGLFAEYYAGYFGSGNDNTPDNLSFFTKAPSLSRIDQQLNFSSNAAGIPRFGDIRPAATSTTNPDKFSARYRGSVYIPVAGAYTFSLQSDDASYLWLDGAAFAPALTNATINNGGAYTAAAKTATVTLSAGLHNILVYYGDNGQNDLLQLRYSSAGITEQIIPNTALCAGQSPLPPTAIGVINSPTMLNTSAATAINTLAGTDPNTGGSITSYIVASLPTPASGALYKGIGTSLITVDQILTAAEAADLSFDPAASFAGNATFTFYAVNSAGIRSNLPATYTIPVNGPVADVTTSLSGPATLGAGRSSGSYTVTFTNNGPLPAENVTQTVDLPVGATLSAAQLAALPATASYDSGTRTINFGTIPVLNSGTSTTYTFSFTAPTALGSGSLVSRVGTSTSQGVNSAVDQFTLNVTTVTGNFFISNDDSNEVPFNSTKTGNVILNDANPQNLADGAFTVQLVSGTTHGTLTLNVNGSYSYTPNSGYLGPDSFTYKVLVPGNPAYTSNISTVSLNVYNSTLVCGIGTGTNLLKNPSFTQGNTSFTSAYIYVATGYTAGNTTSGLYPEARYAVGADASTYHPNFIGTGRNGVGDNFMIVNGSQNLSVVYAQSIPVKPNTYYSFSAYANSVNKESPAQLGFVINGKSTSNVTKLGNTPDYERISDLWFSGSSTTAVFEVRDVNKDPGGNDFGLDDLYFGTCTVGLTANDVLNRGLSNKSPATAISTLSATAAPNTSAVASFTIETLPSASTGILYFNDARVIPGQIIVLDDANKLTFDPQEGFEGMATFKYSATDESGAGSSNTATFSIPVQDRPLPVTLVSFEAQAMRDTDARLDWRTATELNNAHFEVERSFDGRSFASVMRVAGQGTSNSATSYTRTDVGVAAKATGLVYYRLRQVDLDGTSSYSEVKTVQFSRTASISLAPNPTTATTKLDLRQLPQGTYQVQVLDAVGRLVVGITAQGGSQPTLDLRTAPSGTYIVLVRGANGQQFSKRLVKQ